MNESIGKKILRLRLAKDMKQKQLADAVGITEATLSRYENDLRNPKGEIVLKIAQALGVSSDYLLGNENIKNTRNPLPYNAIKIEDKLVKIPILGVIRAGIPIFAEENIEGYEYIEETQVKGGEYFYLKVKGDSMIGARIMDGDLVLIRQQPDVEHGEVAAVRVNGDEATLKRILKVDKAIILQPENHNYQARLCTEKELETGYVEIIGKVMEVKFKL